MKKVVCLTLAAALVVGNSSIAFAHTPKKTLNNNVKVMKVSTQDRKAAVQIKTKEIKVKNKNIEVDLKIPVISGLKDTKIQSSINDKFQKQAVEFKEQLEQWAKEAAEDAKKYKYAMHQYQCNTTFDVHYNKNNILSLSIAYYEYTGGAHGSYERKSYNIDLNTGKEATLKDFFNEQENYKKIINEKIKKEMLKDKDTYYEEIANNFRGIKWNQPFYIEDGNIVVYFGLYEITAYAAGIPEFKIPFSQFQEGVKTKISVEEDPIKIKTKFDEYSDKKITETYQIPVIEGMKDKKIQDKINESIKNKIKQYKVEIEKDADKYYKEFGKDNNKGYPEYSIDVEYEVKDVYKDILSFVITTYEYTGGAHGNTIRETYNIDMKTGNNIKLKDLFNNGVEYKKLINKEIENQINKNKQRYFQGDEGFKGVRDNQSYYIDNGNIVICFGQYEIAPYSSGMPEFIIPQSKLKINF
ncbi:PdaC/SigV domain-containing protein [Haloimpatiens sp. FM7330]|uniref:PdaC/SigV domain-containing protein n=1 Tax=Haloimpatiens sp. FM7330 TaxID=3298610 RepID=UPI003633BFFE